MTLSITLLCHYADSLILVIVILNVIMLSVIMLKVVRLGVLAPTNALSCRIFEHFALLPDPVTELLKLGSALHKQGTILEPKISGSAFL